MFETPEHESVPREDLEQLSQEQQSETNTPPPTANVPLRTLVHFFSEYRKTRWRIRGGIAIIFGSALGMLTTNEHEMKNKRLPPFPVELPLAGMAAGMALGIRSYRKGRLLRELIDDAAQHQPDELRSVVRELSGNAPTVDRKHFEWLKTNILGLHPDTEL